MEFPNKKYEGLHIPNLLSIEDEKKLFASIDCNIFDSLFISKRIGSESQFGTIWLCSLNISSGNILNNNEGLKLSFIIKVQANRNKAQSEFKIQNYLSHTWSENFLVSYGSIDCPEVIMRDNEQVTVIKTGNFIFMETAIGDLSQVIKYSIVNENMLTSHILDIIESVEIMSSVKIFHGDLHIRQIFIVLRNINHCEQTQKAVIGDFGESLEIESPTIHLSDLKVFFKSLLEVIDYVENSQNFTIKILNCLDFISRQSTQVELNDSFYDIESIRLDILEIKKFFI
jgi:hypothetical protein